MGGDSHKIAGLTGRSWSRPAADWATRTGSPMRWHELPRFFRTLRHLRTSQVYWRARYPGGRRLSRVVSKKSHGTAGGNVSVPRVRCDFPRAALTADSAAP